jgi:hypothetical protein
VQHINIVPTVLIICSLKDFVLAGNLISYTSPHPPAVDSVEAMLTASQQHPHGTTADQPQQQQLLVTADHQQQLIGADRQFCQILESDGTIQACAVPFRDFSFSAAVNLSILTFFSF